MSREVARSTQKRFRELRVSEARYEEYLLSEADERYLNTWKIGGSSILI
ncbi:MAG: hypothetical protein QXQ31_04585 [Zestosphaera sp.]